MVLSNVPIGPGYRRVNIPVERMPVLMVSDNYRDPTVEENYAGLADVFVTAGIET